MSVADQIAASIRRRGRLVQIRSVVSSGSSSRPTNTATDSDPVYATFSQFKEVDGEIVQKNDVRARLSSSVTISEEDQVVDGSVVYSIESLHPIQPGDEVFLYTAQLRSSA